MTFEHIWDPGFESSLRPIDVGTATILIKTNLPTILSAITLKHWMRFTWMDRLQVVSLITLSLVQVEDTIAEHPKFCPTEQLDTMTKAMDSLVAVIEGQCHVSNASRAPLIFSHLEANQVEAPGPRFAVNAPAEGWPVQLVDYRLIPASAPLDTLQPVASQPIDREGIAEDAEGVEANTSGGEITTPPASATTMSFDGDDEGTIAPISTSVY